MKKIILSLVLTFAIFAANAQVKENLFSRTNPNQVNLGIGFWNGQSRDFKITTPQLSISYDRCIADMGVLGSIGLGAHASYIQSEYKLTPSDKWTLTEVTTGLRATYHYTVAPNTELYASAMGVYRYNDFSDPAYKYLTKKKSKFNVTGSIGARYFLLDNLGVFLATGDGVYLVTGLTVKF